MTNRRALFFFGLAIVFALAAVYTARQLLETGPAQAAVPVVATTPVTVVKADVGVGFALMNHQLDTVDWPSEYLPAGTFASKERAAGRVLRRPLVAGEPVLEAALLPAGSQAGLAPVIEKNLRAVSVKVDSVVGVAGFVQPGARVDVLATLRRIDQQEKLPYSKVILQDVPVLAVDQKMETAKNGEPEIVNVVTLQVAPEQAEQLIYSAHEGRLQLALRSPGDHEEVKTASVGVADLLGGPKRRVAKGAVRATTTVEVVKGSALEKRSF